jgi:hypothetical protein
VRTPKQALVAAALAAAFSMTTIGAVSAQSYDTGAVSQAAAARKRCTPGYSPCIPNKRSDVDCYGGSGNGPRYTKRGVVYRVARGKDRYGLDSDRDGKGCERS